MAIRMTSVRGTDGKFHELYAAECRDSDKLSHLVRLQWWAVRNDCNGIFAVYPSQAEAEAGCVEIGAESYAVPVVIFVDSSSRRYWGE